MQGDARRVAWWAAALVLTLISGLMWYGLGSGVLPRVVAAIELLSDMGTRGTRPGTNPAGPAALVRERVPVSYTVEDRRRSGDLYEPSSYAEGALVLVPGVVAAGKDDPRLVDFAHSLARAHFRVHVPEIPGLRNLQIDPADAGIIADAVAWLAVQQGGGQVGLAALSYAVGPTLLAALDPRVRHRVGFVLAIGGYHDSVAALTFITTGRFREQPGAPWRQGNPFPYGKWVFVRSNAGLLDDPADQAVLRAIADRRLADFAADTTDLEMRLGPQGRAVMALLANQDPDRVADLIAALPPAVRRTIAALDLSRLDLSQLTARLIVIHGRDDSMIPYTESAALAAALPDGQAELYIIGNLAHVELGPAGFRDTLALWQAIYAVLEARDEPSRPGGSNGGVAPQVR